MEYLGLSARLLIGALFLVAGASKLRDLSQFRAEVANYQVLPAALVTPTARALPALEVVVGAMLLLGVLIVPVAVVAAVVLVAFAGGIWINVQRERRIGCGCGFRRRQEVSNRLVLRNAGYTAAAVVAAVWPSAALALAPGPGVPASTLTVADALGVAVATATAAAIVVVGLDARRFLAQQRASAAVYAR